MVILMAFDFNHIEVTGNKKKRQLDVLLNSQISIKLRAAFLDPVPIGWL